MRIDSKAPSLPLSSTTGARRSTGTQRFALEGQATASTGSAHATTSLASVDALLALQGEADPGETRRRSIRRGHDLLDALDRLKAAILSGRVPASDLKAIAARLTERAEASGDPRLDELVLHIELRAGVELAKLGQA